MLPQSIVASRYAALYITKLVTLPIRIAPLPMHSHAAPLVPHLDMLALHAPSRRVKTAKLCKVSQLSTCVCFGCSVSGTALWERMQNSFGYLTSGQGYQGHVFPVVIGETGSMYLTVSATSFDRATSRHSLFITVVPLLEVEAVLMQIEISPISDCVMMSESTFQGTSVQSKCCCCIVQCPCVVTEQH